MDFRYNKHVNLRPAYSELQDQIYDLKQKCRELDKIVRTIKNIGIGIIVILVIIDLVSFFKG